MRGSLFTGNRLESGFALLAHMVNRGLGGKSQLKDFMPHADRDSPQILNSVEDEIGAVMANLNAARVK